MVLEPIPPLMEWRRGSPLDISQWRTEIRGYVRDNTTSISLTGPSVEALNLAIFSAIRHQEFGTPFVLPSEVVCGESAAAPSDLQYFAPGATYSIGNIDHQATLAHGDGPERAVLTNGVSLRIAGPDTDPEAILQHAKQARWALSGTFHRPTFCAESYLADTERCKEFFVDARCAILCMVQLGVAPLPLCPFVLFLATQTESSNCVEELSLAYINHLDPPTAHTLQPWYNIKAEDIFVVTGNLQNPGKDENHKGLQLAVIFGEANILVFTSPRSEETHAQIHRRVIYAYFLGNMRPWEHNEFITFRCGLKIKLNNMMDTGDCWTTPIKCAKMIAAFYDRRIKDPEQLISRLNIVLDTTSEYQSPEAKHISLSMMRLFRWRFFRWLRGRGFPPQLLGTDLRAKEGIISHERYRQDSDSTTIRSTMFLYSLTEVQMIPIHGAQLRIDVRDSLLNQENEFREPTVSWHTCSQSVEFYLNDWLKNVLLEPCSLLDASVITDFDVWMSKLTSLKGRDFNRI
ncbi:hypothetical protein C8J57DRAFT_1397565 [Mycena rebaudengoi]|nr:hypothetical protein C8J57DRAFT_1397565 [Mycena rebaudengoi]